MRSCVAVLGEGSWRTAGGAHCGIQELKSIEGNVFGAFDEMFVTVDRVTGVLSYPMCRVTVLHFMPDSHSRPVSAKCTVLYSRVLYSLYGYWDSRIFPYTDI